MARVLILDDNEDLHFVLDCFMENDDLTHCYSHESAVENLEKGTQFDVVYLDYYLKQFHTGYDTAHFIVESLPRSKWPKKVVVHSCDDIVGKDMAEFLRSAGLEAEHRIFGD